MTRVGLVWHYENESNYSVLLWDTGSGALKLRSLRHNRSTVFASGKIHSDKVRLGQTGAVRQAWTSLVMRVVMGYITCYIDGEKVLTGRESSLLGRVAIFALGHAAVQLDGVEVRILDARESDADVFGPGRVAFETQCTACHRLNGPWNMRYAPDDWESVVNEMLLVEHADKYITRSEANRIIDYLRIISLHPDRNRYRPPAASDTEPDIEVPYDPN